MDEYKSGKVNFEHLISKEDKIAVDTLWATEKSDFYYLRHKMIKKDGTDITVDAIATHFERDGRKLVRVSLSDYPHQKELADKSDSYRREIEVLTSDIVGGVAMLYADDLSIYRCNDVFRSFLDLGEGEDVPPIDFYADENEKKRLLDTVADAVEHNIPAEIEVHLQISGSDRWFLFVGRPFDKIDGRTLLYFILYDMTHEQKMIAELELEAARYRFITKSLDHIFVDYDVKSDVMSFSSAVNRYGSPEVTEFLAEHKAYENIHPDDLVIFSLPLPQLLQHRPFQMSPEAVILRPQGALSKHARFLPYQPGKEGDGIFPVENKAVAVFLVLIHIDLHIGHLVIFIISIPELVALFCPVDLVISRHLYGAIRPQLHLPPIVLAEEAAEEALLPKELGLHGDSFHTLSLPAYRHSLHSLVAYISSSSSRAGS